MPVLFADAVMFTSKDCTIPEDILVKGKPVAISGYLRPNVVTKDDVDITVCGMQHDQEIDSLLDYVNIGSVIEVPIKLDSSLSVAKEEIRQRNFHQVLVCEVFCVE